jgi:hypothetical protein
MIILAQVVIAMPTKPVILSNSPVDISLNGTILLNLTFSTDVQNNTISYQLLEGSNVIVDGINQSIVSLSRLVGNYSFSLCAFTIDGVNCSDSVNVTVFYGAKPIMGSIPEMSVTPTYSDSTIAKRVFGIIITDPNQVWVNASIYPSEDDYYGDDSTNSSVVDCVEGQIIGNNHYFNCTIMAYRNLQPGFYNIDVVSGNPYNSVEQLFQNKLVVNNLLSANISFPEIDFNDFYNGWAQSSSPVVINNTGNVAFSEFGVQTYPIQCNSRSFSTDDILLNYRLSRSSAVVCDPMAWFSRKIYRGNSQEVYLFVRNNDTVSNCRFVWDLVARWRE